MAQWLKKSACSVEDTGEVGSIPGSGRSSILAWEVPGTEEPGGLQSMGSQSQTRLSMHAFAKELKAKVTTTFCWVVAGHDS